MQGRGGDLSDGMLITLVIRRSLPVFKGIPGVCGSGGSTGGCVLPCTGASARAWMCIAAAATLPSQDVGSPNTCAARETSRTHGSVYRIASHQGHGALHETHPSFSAWTMSFVKSDVIHHGIFAGLREVSVYCPTVSHGSPAHCRVEPFMVTLNPAAAVELAESNSIVLLAWTGARSCRSSSAARITRGGRAGNYHTYVCYIHCMPFKTPRPCA